MRKPLMWLRLPPSVPASNDALYARYELPVRKLIVRRVRYGIPHPDAENEVWARLFRARVIDCYVLNKLTHEPDLTEACFRRYLLCAAGNHLKNVFRTLARRANRERTLGEDFFRRQPFGIS